MSESSLEQNKLDEIAGGERSLADLTRPGTTERVKPFGIQWPAVWWLKWATIHHMLLERGSPGREPALPVS